MSSIRRPAVSGVFYSDEPGKLSSDVKRYLQSAKTADENRTPKILIVPHAGFIYSGVVAGGAYAAIEDAAETITKVVLIGPSHRIAFRGMATPSVEAFETPLGATPVDQDALAAIAALPGVTQRDDAHAQEHSLEVQLPFLQSVLGEFTLAPIVVGDATGDDVAALIETLWGGDETLIVIGSDLSHYLDDQAAQRMDAATADAIETLSPENIGRDQACGRIPVAGALLAARARNMRVVRYDLRNSGATAGGKDRVVGYGAWGIVDDNAKTHAGDQDSSDRQLLRQHGAQLLHAAAASIKRGLSKGAPPEVDLASFPDLLQENRATFVTLKKDGQLRGCIGTITAHRPLLNDVVENAYAAAFRDHRFPPLQADELGALNLSISLLSKPTPMTFNSEGDFKAQLQPGRDGLIIEDQGRRAVFLPQVWDELPTTSQFVAHLKQKAGLAENHWSASFQAWRFSATSLHPNTA
jgi:AmmeMemoRadiSam system protein B/AmmeMemoRadiSam system protein A